MLFNLLIQVVCNVTEIIRQLNSAGSKSHCDVVHDTEGQVQEAAEDKVLAKKCSMAYISD